jgi:hypothetical protein
VIRLVLDASLFGAVGAGTGSAEPAPSCVAVLEAVRVGPYAAAQNDALAEEWRLTESVYLLQWQDELNSRGRLLTHNEPWPEETALLTARSKNEIAINKDVHLIRLSMVTDRRLVSMDNKLRAALGRVLKRGGCPTTLMTLHFVVPHNPKVKHDALGWLQRGAPEDPSLQLGA